jgi:hypothetical protein
MDLDQTFGGGNREILRGFCHDDREGDLPRL